MRKAIFLLAAGAFAICCNSNQHKIIYADADNVETIHLVADTSITMECLSPGQVICNGNILIVCQGTNGPQVKVFDIKAGKSYEHINKGRGPGEVIGLNCISLSPDGKTLLLSDISQRKLLVCRIEDLLSTDSIVPVTEEMNLQEYPFLTSICSDGNSIYAMALNDSSRIMKVAEGAQSQAFADYSPDTRKNMTGRFIQQAYMGTMQYNLEHNAIVIGCRYSDQIEVLDLRNGNVRFFKGPDLFEPEYEILDIQGGVLSHKDSERKGYIDIKTSGDHIYALFSGRTREDQNSAFGNEIRAFSWSGELERVYRLDNDIFSFDISPEGRIYASSADERILVFGPVIVP